MRTTKADPIIAEVRAVRDEHAARFDYDIDAIFRAIRAAQEMYFINSNEEETQSAPIASVDGPVCFILGYVCLIRRFGLRDVETPVRRFPQVALAAESLPAPGRGIGNATAEERVETVETRLRGEGRCCVCLRQVTQDSPHLSGGRIEQNRHGEIRIAVQCRRATGP